MRWLKMSKYLPRLGWQPVIYTPSNPDSSVYDESLLKEVNSEISVIKRPIWEPYNIYRKLTGKGKETKFKPGFVAEASGGGWKEKLSVFIRGNLLIPDPRKFWIRPSVRFLRKWLKKNPVDLIISTGPPHSMHLIALEIKKQYNIPWLADFRDPWTKIDFYDRLRLTPWADLKHRDLERKVLAKADYVTTVSPSWADDFRSISGRHISVITNGFDPEDFKFENISTDKEFSITHIGSFNQDRNPVRLWEILSDLGKENPGFFEHLKIRLIGQTDPKVFDSLEDCGLIKFVEQHNYMEHGLSLRYLKQSQVLLLPLNNAHNVKGIIPGKFFEYLAVQRPVLAIGPEDGDCGQLLEEAGAGIICGFEDTVKLKSAVLQFYERYLDNRLSLNPGPIDRFSRENLARQIMGLIELSKS